MAGYDSSPSTSLHWPCSWSLPPRPEGHGRICLQNHNALSKVLDSWSKIENCQGNILTFVFVGGCFVVSMTNFLMISPTSTLPSLELNSWTYFVGNIIYARCPQLFNVSYLLVFDSSNESVSTHKTSMNHLPIISNQQFLSNFRIQKSTLLSLDLSNYFQKSRLQEFSNLKPSITICNSDLILIWSEPEFLKITIYRLHCPNLFLGFWSKMESCQCTILTFRFVSGC